MKHSNIKAILISAALFTSALLLAACDDKTPKQSAAPLVSSANKETTTNAKEPVIAEEKTLQAEKAITTEIISEENVSEPNKDTVQKIKQAPIVVAKAIDEVQEAGNKVVTKTIEKVKDAPQVVAKDIEKMKDAGNKVADKAREISAKNVAKALDISDKAVQLLPETN